MSPQLQTRARPVNTPPPRPPQFEPLLKATQVANALGVGHKRVYTLVGHLAIRYSPRQMRWRPSDLQAWLNDRRERMSS